MVQACRLRAEPETLQIDTSVLLVSLIMRRFQPGSPPGFFLPSGSSARIRMIGFNLAFTMAILWKVFS